MWPQNYHPVSGWLSILLAAAADRGAAREHRHPAHPRLFCGLARLVGRGCDRGPDLRHASAIAAAAAAFGAAYGLLPIGWIVLNIIFLYQPHRRTRPIRDPPRLDRAGQRRQPPAIAVDRLLLGAFFEGVAGFGAPVAVTGAMLIGLGFTRLQASGLSLIANTAPVAFGALGVQPSRLRW